MKAALRGISLGMAGPSSLILSLLMIAAALLAGEVDAPDGSVVVVSGGNVDPALYAEILAEGP